MKIKIAFWVIFGLSLFTAAWLRIGIPYDDIMKEDIVRFPSVDAYYHLMAADYTYDNWPDVEQYNELMTWPDGANVGERPLNNWLMATIAKFGGFSVDSVGAYWPAILGVLVLIPALVIGWLLWGRWAGLIGAALLATMQGEFLGRTSLGFCDHHAFEVFLSVTTVMFLVLALKKHWYWAFGAGFFLGLHLLNWVGGPLLTILILVSLVIQVIYNQWKGQSNRDLCLSMFITLGLSFVVLALFRWEDQMYMLSLGIVACIPPVLYAVSKAMVRFKSYWYPIALVFAAVLGMVLVYGIFPTLTSNAIGQVGRLFGEVGHTPLSAGRTISEIRPMFSPFGEFTMELVWGGYGLVFFAGVIGLILLGYAIRKGKSETIFIFIWSLGILIIASAQRRFGYYLATNLCLLSGYACWLAISYLGWRKLTRWEARRRKMPQRYFSNGVAVVGAFVILCAMVIPNGTIAAREAHYHPYAMPPSWQAALEWLENESPVTEYVATIEETNEGLAVSTIRPKCDYSILSWWDYGYWIAREAKRPVLCHPGGGFQGVVASFFVAQTVEEANEIIDGFSVKYVIIDYQMVSGKFYAIPVLAGIENFTEENYNNSVVVSLYFSEEGIEGYREVFESSQQFKGQGQVKIYEKYEVPEKG